MTVQPDYDSSTHLGYALCLLDQAMAAGPEGDHALTLKIVQAAKREVLIVWRAAQASGVPR
jgi:hypothetical protein